MNLNKAELIGNLAADPVVRTLPSDRKIATFSLATQFAWKDGKTKSAKREVEFHSIVAHGRLAEVVVKYLKKGDRVYVEGRLRTAKWQGKDSLQKHRTDIIVGNLIMLGQKSGKPTEKGNDEVVVDEVEIDRVPAVKE